MTTTDSNIIICDKDNGTTYTLKKGFKGKIVLEGNASTGYAWRTQRLVGDSVRLGKWTYVPKPVPPFFVGGGGSFELDFEVVKTGMSTILLVYDTPFQPRPMGYDYFIRIDGRDPV